MAKQREITQADIDANPIVTELGGAVGDKIATSLSDEKQAEKDAADVAAGQAEQAQA